MVGKAPELRGEVSGRGRRFAIVASRFHKEICARLVEGARAALRRHGAADRDVAVVWVPGAFEIPQVARRLAVQGEFDALICVGCVIRGETPHFEYVAGEAARGIADVGLTTGVPVTFGVITAESLAQARDRAGGKVGNRGEEAALAALELVGLLRALEQSPKGGRRSGGRPAATARRQGAGRPPRGRDRPENREPSASDPARR
jgi:6,7-dimethyl-8-ribityllumazine synthase